MKSTENVILNHFRENVHSASEFDTHEYLFQLARHWSLWQDMSMGTFPLDYSDPSGPAGRDFAEETGEDFLYWELMDELNVLASKVTGAQVQETISFAVKILDRLDEVYSVTPGKTV